MTKAYDRVLTALTYIWGPMVNDWVNTQEGNLVTGMDTTQPNHVHKDDEVLWAEFETAFTIFAPALIMPLHSASRPTMKPLTS